MTGAPRILAIDPGTTESGWCHFSGGKVEASGVMENWRMLDHIGAQFGVVDYVAIEMIASYGMAVGKEVFETCVWIGRFQQTWPYCEDVRFVYRRDVKLHLCGSPRAKDANVRVALLDLYGGKEAAVGRKANPGPLYSVKSHAWAALGVAVTAAHQLQQNQLSTEGA